MSSVLKKTDKLNLSLSLSLCSKTHEMNRPVCLDAHDYFAVLVVNYGISNTVVLKIP